MNRQIYKSQQTPKNRNFLFANKISLMNDQSYSKFQINAGLNFKYFHISVSMGISLVIFPDKIIRKYKL